MDLLKYYDRKPEARFAGDSTVVIKFYIKTRPLMQWKVKWEMLRRIKKKFDEQEIEIPFPHHMLCLRSESKAGEDELQASLSTVESM